MSAWISVLVGAAPLQLLDGGARPEWPWVHEGHLGRVDQVVFAVEVDYEGQYGDLPEATQVDRGYDNLEYPAAVQLAEQVVDVSEDGLLGFLLVGSDGLNSVIKEAATPEYVHHQSHRQKSHRAADCRQGEIPADFAHSTPRGN